MALFFIVQVLTLSCWNCWHKKYLLELDLRFIIIYSYRDFLFFPPFLLPVALTLSLSQACIHTLPDQPELRHLIGLVGVDLHMEDVVQDITYYSHADSSYAFIISTKGGSTLLPISEDDYINNPFSSKDTFPPWL